MSEKNTFVFKALHIVVWVIFVGLCIDAGGLIVSFIISMVKPEYLGNLYQKLDLSQLYQQKKSAFFGAYSFLLIISILKAILFYILIQMLQKLNISKPFSTEVATKIKNIASYTLSIGIINLLAIRDAKNLLHKGYEIGTLAQFWESSQAYFLMAAVIYVISQIFTRGVELQNENDLTV